jgi:hypothetical protein
MAKHKYAVGQTVDFSPGFAAGPGKGQFTIVRQLPAEGDTPQYRVKSTRDGHERMVLESQLAKPANSAASSIFAPRRLDKRFS